MYQYLYQSVIKICLEDTLQIVCCVHYSSKRHAPSPKAREKYGTMLGKIRHVVILKKRQPKS